MLPQAPNGKIQDFEDRAPRSAPTHAHLIFLDDATQVPHASNEIDQPKANEGHLLLEGGSVNKHSDRVWVIFASSSCLHHNLYKDERSSCAFRGLRIHEERLKTPTRRLKGTS